MQQNINKISVIGGGSWGTALMILLTNNLEKVGWWVRSQDTVDYLQNHHRNPNYLSYTELPVHRMHLSTNMQQIIDESEVLIFAVPAAFLKKSLDEAGIKSLKGKFVISAIKGIVPEYNMVISEFLETHYEVSHGDLAFVAGPCHSEEVAMQKLSYLTLSGIDAAAVEDLCQDFASWHLKISPNNDLRGTEYAAVMKNVIAIAAGIASGLNYGDNFIAVLISNAVQEMKRLLKAVSPVPRDSSASVYLGDVMVTAYSRFSRNRLFGTLIGKGYSLQATMAEMNMVAEGYYAVKSLMELNKELEVDMPVMECVYNIVYGGVSPHTEFRNLADKLR
jgi:glycerol-3-phosphate dehydrogenase (NAD(P)+)